MHKWVIGVDEAGRGPLAGPVVVGAALVPQDFDWALLPGVNDSKQLSEKKREEIFKTARKLKASGQLDYQVSMVSAKTIDQKGIVFAINKALIRALTRVSTSRFDLEVLQGRTLKTGRNISGRGSTSPTEAVFKDIIVKLDGGLKAPEQFENQETIIKGDSKEKVIGLASIMAKVTRDRYMRRRAKLAAFAPYDFSTHKGYGTKAHRAAIAEYGLSSEHRASYCKNIKMF